jgi:hypothetical protein
MQNHPTLPIVAASGIENTIKILSPSTTISTSSLDQQEVLKNLVGNGDAIAQRNREHRDDSADAFGAADVRLPIYPCRPYAIKLIISSLVLLWPF